MHELGIARDLWAVICEYAKTNKLTNITKITLAIGEASGIESDFLRHSFESHIIPGTIAAGAQIEIVMEKLSARCNECNTELTKEAMNSVHCPGCGGMSIAITAGKETYVKSIEGL
jgi:hydrogenase nickel incorporation protein HypA/HybF